MAEEIIYSGKSKIVLKSEEPDTFIIRYKDSATAFNGEKKDEIEGKGKLNAEISNLIFEYLMENGVQTHLIRQIDDISVLVKRVEIVPVEVIIRNIAAGGFSKKYGIAEGMNLKNIVIEYCYKSDELGDPMMNETQITAIGLATQEELEQMRQQALKINLLLIDLFDKAGILLADFKLEFGRSKGEIILSDEISPDSCRLWDKETGQKLDKDLFRRDLGSLIDGYTEVLGRLKNVRSI